MVSSHFQELDRRSPLCSRRKASTQSQTSLQSFHHFNCSLNLTSQAAPFATLSSLSFRAVSRSTFQCSLDLGKKRAAKLPVLLSALTSPSGKQNTPRTPRRGSVVSQKTHLVQLFQILQNLHRSGPVTPKRHTRCNVEEEKRIPTCVRDNFLITLSRFQANFQVFVSSSPPPTSPARHISEVCRVFLFVWEP